MLPTSKEYLIRAGFSSRAAAYLLIGLFLAGVVVIQLVSGFIHRHIPSHVVDCRHTHEPHTKDPEEGNGDIDIHYHHHHTVATEHTPLISRQGTPTGPPAEPVVPYSEMPLTSRLSRQISSLVGGTKPFCDENGPCYGFSHACGKECTKTIVRDDVKSVLPRDHSATSQPDTEGQSRGSGTESLLHPSSHIHETGEGNLPLGIHGLDSFVDDRDMSTTPPPLSQSATLAAPAQHHHHVPKNAFLAIGLQTSLAIALHKLPEGFITYATNHTNPTLGFSVFMALFVHNITEGFAMALPLYLALNSRLKAMIWSSLLGGISQPAGAGIAALWIWGAGKATGDKGTDPADISWAVYGGMFAATAGVMTSVSLQLFSEGLVLSHNRSLCIGFAIFGMGILGMSFALTA
ncbi:hypothetical protein FQN51_000414 [Onygenales sp. PD_10]|nr:hypothetical protein FQN51_000414 [Onygenales sp. PD_10]